MTSSPLIALGELETLLARVPTEPSRPKYTRLAEAIQDGILSGKFEPGQRIPTETDLAKSLPLSVGTIQKALGKLASMGLIIRNRKSGSFIADRDSRVNEVFVYRFKDPVTGALMMPFVNTRAVVRDDSAGPWTAFLDVETCIRVDRIVGFDGQTPAFSSVYFKPEHGAVFLDKALDDLNGSSVHRMLIDQFSLPTVRMQHSFTCQLLPETAREHLQLPAASHGIIWDIKDFTLRDRPVLFQRYHLPPGHAPIEIDELSARQTAPAPAASNTPRPTNE